MTTGMILVIIVFGAGISVPITGLWLDHRRRTRALDILRVYAERGEEPPSAVLNGLTTVASPWGGAPPEG